MFTERGCSLVAVTFLSPCRNIALARFFGITDDMLSLISTGSPLYVCVFIGWSMLCSLCHRFLTVQLWTTQARSQLCCCRTLFLSDLTVTLCLLAAFVLPVSI